MRHRQKRRRQRDLAHRHVLLKKVTVTDALTAISTLATCNRCRGSINGRAETIIQSTRTLCTSGRPFRTLLRTVHDRRRLQNLNQIRPRLGQRTSRVLRRVILGVRRGGILAKRRTTILTTDCDPSNGCLTATKIRKGVCL